MSKDKHASDIGDVEPYISFYTKNKISPVHQDLSDLELHYSRRDHLYRNMGILPFSISGKSVLEFGPGSGHNALYTTSLNPERYLLVDINPTGLEESKALLNEYFPNAGCHEFVLSRIQHFETDDRFDVVLCEGVIPHQTDSAAFAKHIGKFVKPGGILVITTADHVSSFSEILRRLIAETVVKPNMTVDEQLKVLVPIFEPHFKTIKGTSRPVEHWVLDNIINDWHTPVFSIESSIRAMASDFEICGTMPRFLSDWRWYKNVYGEDARLNEIAIEQYINQGISLIDGRCVMPQMDEKTSRAIRELCDGIGMAMVQIQVERMDRWQYVSDTCAQIADLLRPYNKETAEAVDETVSYFAKPGALDPATHFDKFRSLFGHSQQYISFVRRRNSLEVLS